MADVTTMIVSGPLCADAADCRLLGSALFGEELAGAEPHGLRIGVSRATSSPRTSLPRCARPARRRPPTLAEAAGGEVRTVSLPDLDASALAAVLIANGETMGELRPRRLNELEPGAEPGLPRLRQVPDADAGRGAGQGGRVYAP